MDTSKRKGIKTYVHRVDCYNIEYGKFGIGICYDMRFPEMAIIAARKGCLAMIYPGAFNMTTGPMHWELLQRARFYELITLQFCFNSMLYIELLTTKCMSLLVPLHVTWKQIIIHGDILRW